jgi:hypothetical protein
VLNNEGSLKAFREPRFLNVCRELAKMKNKRVLVFETHPFTCRLALYHARHNEVYFDGRLISDSIILQGLPFSNIPDLENVDFVVTHDRILDLKAPGLSYLASIDDTSGEDRTKGQVHYMLGPPARLRFLVSRPVTANVKMRLAPVSGTATFPIDFFLTDAQGHLSHGELW